MNLKQAEYCMKSYLPTNKVTHCTECPYYGKHDALNGQGATCESSVAHVMAAKALHLISKMKETLKIPNADLRNKMLKAQVECFKEETYESTMPFRDELLHSSFFEPVDNEQFEDVSSLKSKPLPSAIMCGFSCRKAIESMFLDWCKCEGVATEPNSLVAYMLLHDWLNIEKIDEDLKALGK